MKLTLLLSAAIGASASPELVIETAATPDEVLVGALGQASENVIWLAHIFVGPLVANSAATASE